MNVVGHKTIGQEYVRILVAGIIQQMVKFREILLVFK
jgi:hypothetical protein